MGVDESVTSESVNSEEENFKLLYEAALANVKAPSLARPTPSCPSVPRFAVAFQRGWKPQEAQHVQGCQHCLALVELMEGDRWVVNPVVGGQTLRASVASLSEKHGRPGLARIADKVVEYVCDGLGTRGFRSGYLFVILPALFAVVAASFIVWHRPGFAAITLLAYGMLEMFDAELARRTVNQRQCILLDYQLDRLADVVILGSIAYAERGPTATLTIAVLIVMLISSYTRAQNDALHVPVRWGSAGRAVRLLALFVGLVFRGALVPCLYVVGIISAVTWIMRFALGWKRAGSNDIRIIDEEWAHRGVAPVLGVGPAGLRSLPIVENPARATDPGVHHEIE